MKIVLAKCRSLQLVVIHTDSVDMHCSGWGGGVGGGWRDQRWWRRNTVVWQVIHKVNTTVPQLQNPIGVHQESHSILDLFPLFQSTNNLLFFTLIVVFRRNIQLRQVSHTTFVPGQLSCCSSTRPCLPHTTSLSLSLHSAG